jgi:hypothetical protein
VINVVSSDEVTSTVMGYADECSGEHSHEYSTVATMEIQLLVVHIKTYPPTGSNPRPHD